MKRFIFTSLSVLSAFGVGFCVGSHLTEKKMEEKMNEEVKAAEEYYEKQYLKQVDDAESSENEIDDSLEIATDIISKFDYSTLSTPEVTPDTEEECEIEIISADEYGEDLDYDMVDNLTYYADGYLVDDYDEVIENYADLVGEEAFSAFGQYDDDDVVHVKNNVKKTYYQIMRSDEKYSNIVWETKIHLDE